MNGVMILIRFVYSRYKLNPISNRILPEEKNFTLWVGDFTLEVDDLELYKFYTIISTKGKPWNTIEKQTNKHQNTQTNTNKQKNTITNKQTNKQTNKHHNKQTDGQKKKNAELNVVVAKILCIHGLISNYKRIIDSSPSQQIHISSTFSHFLHLYFLKTF